MRRPLHPHGARLDRLAVLAALAVALALGLPLAAHPAPTQLGATADTPRAFGYVVGDRVTRRIALDVPSGLTLDEASLPKPGGKGRALELRRVALRRSLFGTPEALELEYQVFVAPREVRVVEMPPVELRFDGPTRPQTVRIDAWPVTVAPLTPPDASPREGLGEMRPDQPPPPVDTRRARIRLAVEAAAAAVLFGYLAQVYLVLPWSARRRRPFGRAWAALRGLPAAADAAQRRAAFERIHRALDETAGEALFAPALDRFVAVRPAFAPLRGELARFFERSRVEFFAAAPVADDARWLTTLCRRCRDLERGSA